MEVAAKRMRFIFFFAMFLVAVFLVTKACTKSNSSFVEADVEEFNPSKTIGAANNINIKEKSELTLKEPTKISSVTKESGNNLKNIKSVSLSKEVKELSVKLEDDLKSFKRETMTEEVVAKAVPKVEKAILKKVDVTKVLDKKPIIKPVKKKQVRSVKLTKPTKTVRAKNKVKSNFVKFENLSMDLNSSSKRRIKELVSSYGNKPSPSKVHLKGTWVGFGKTDAIKRAERVKNYLVESGLRPDKIYISTKEEKSSALDSGVKMEFY